MTALPAAPDNTTSTASVARWLFAHTQAGEQQLRDALHRALDHGWLSNDPWEVRCNWRQTRRSCARPPPLSQLTHPRNWLFAIGCDVSCQCGPIGSAQCAEVPEYQHLIKFKNTPDGTISARSAIRMPEPHEVLLYAVEDMASEANAKVWHGIRDALFAQNQSGAVRATHATAQHTHTTRSRPTQRPMRPSTRHSPNRYRILPLHVHVHAHALRNARKCTTAHSTPSASTTPITFTPNRRVIPARRRTSGKQNRDTPRSSPPL